MATDTAFLKLKLPLNGEFQDSWDGPTNDNFQKIDDFAAAVDTELSDARFGQDSIKDFLEVAHESSGELKPTPEVLRARNSFLYGDETPTPDDYLLHDRIHQADTEIFKAQEGQLSVRDTAAIRSLLPSCILAGSKNSNSYPTWLGFTGDNAQIDGTSDELLFLIDGYLQRVRTLEQVEISGAAATYYLYAEYSEDGQIVVDGDSSTPPPASPNGVTGALTSQTKVCAFLDATTDFVSAGIQERDVLDVVSGINEGRYLIRTVAADGDNNKLRIFGVFPGGSLSGINYVIKDPLKPTLGFSATNTPTAGRLYIGEVDFDGSAVTAVRALHFKDVFVGEWRAVVGGNFTEVFNHNLLTDVLDVCVQVSQSNTGASHVEELAVAGLTNTLAIAVTNGIVQAADVFNPGSTNATFTQGLLSGTVTAAFTGALNQNRSCKLKWTKTQITVANLVTGVFYTDYAGAAQTTGYVRVVVRKRG